MCFTKKITVTLELTEDENLAVAQFLVDLKKNKFQEPNIQTLDDNPGGEPVNPGKPSKP